MNLVSVLLTYLRHFLICFSELGRAGRWEGERTLGRRKRSRKGLFPGHMGDNGCTLRPGRGCLGLTGWHQMGRFTEMSR